MENYHARSFFQTAITDKHIIWLTKLQINDEFPSIESCKLPTSLQTKNTQSRFFIQHATMKRIFFYWLSVRSLINGAPKIEFEKIWHTTARHEATTTTMICDTPAQKFNKCSMFVVFLPNAKRKSVGLDFYGNRNVLLPIRLLHSQKKKDKFIASPRLINDGKIFRNETVLMEINWRIRWVIFYEHWRH